MDDATRKAIKEVLDRTGSMFAAALGAVPVSEVVLAFLRDALAREAEYTTPVTPEWLDGAEARRLGLALQADVSHAFGNRIRRWSSGVVELIESDEIMRLHGITYYDPLYSPTIAQVRAAVYLATGRR